MAIREAEQVHVARGSVCGVCGWHVRRMRHVRDTNGGGARAREAETSTGACDVVFGHSWLGFARDWLFCHSMPSLWQLDEQIDDIREL